MGEWGGVLAQFGAGPFYNRKVKDGINREVGLGAGVLLSRGKKGGRGLSAPLAWQLGGH